MAAIVALGAAFCTLNLYGWDNDTRQHPDERFMTLVADRLKMPAGLSEYLDSSRNPLNPRNSSNTFYVYGLLPQTLTHLTAVVLTPYAALPPTVRGATPGHWDAAPFIPNPDRYGPRSALLQVLLNPNGDDLTSVRFVQRVGRSWSALFQLLSIVVVFLIGRRLYGRRVGLLAALFLAGAALPIQLAHFFTVDTATAFFTLLAIYWAVRAAHNGGIGSFTALGLSIGAAMACRVTMAALGLAAVVAVTLRLWGAQGEANQQRAASSPHRFTCLPHRLSCTCLYVTIPPVDCRSTIGGGTMTRKRAENKTGGVSKRPGKRLCAKRFVQRTLLNTRWSEVLIATDSLSDVS